MGKYIPKSQRLPRGVKRRKNFALIENAFKQAGYILLSKAEDYINCNTKLQYICSNHPNIIQEIDWRHFQRGQRCPLCRPKRIGESVKYSLNEVIEILKEHGYIYIDGDYQNYHSKLKIKCQKHPEEVIEVEFGKCSLNSQKKWICPKCKAEDKQIKLKLRQEEQYEKFCKKCKEKGYIPISKLEDYKNHNSLVVYKCSKHGIFSASFTNFVDNNTGCPICKSSKGELKIIDFLNKNNIDFQRQKKFKELFVSLNGNINNKNLLSYDFYLPEYNLLIEYQGEYHDGTVHKLNPKRQTLKDLEEQQYRDKLKKQYALDHNINFLEIWYWDFNEIEKILKEALEL